jgi:hypothetical protein
MLIVLASADRHTLRLPRQEDNDSGQGGDNGRPVRAAVSRHLERVTVVQASA